MTARSGLHLSTVRDAQTTPMLNLRAALKPFVDRWPQILAATIVPAFFVFLWFQAKPLEYTASAQVLINRTQLDLGEIADVIDDGFLGREQIFTELEVIRSQPVLSHVIEQLIAEDRMEPLATDEFPDEDRVTAGVLSLRLMLDVDLRVDSYIADVAVTAPDRVWATDVANLVAQSYLGFQRSKKIQLADDALVGINTELASLEEQISEAALALTQAQQEFASRNRFDTETTEAEIRRLSSELTELRSQIATAEAINERLSLALESDVSTSGLDTNLADVEAISNRIKGLSSELAAQTASAGASSAAAQQLERQIAGLERVLRNAITREIQSNEAVSETLRAREARVVILLAKAREDRFVAERADREIARFEQRANALATVYSNVLERKSEIAAQRDLTKADATLLAEASIPVLPSGPPVMANVLAGRHSWVDGRLQPDRDDRVLPATLQRYGRA